MLTILHGEHIDASRKELQRLKSSYEGRDIRNIDGRHIDETMLRQTVESISLFGDTTLVVIENLFSSLGRKLKLIEQYALIISEAAKTTDIIIWEEKDLVKTVLDNVGKATICPFPLPKIIFTFLDNIKPGNAKISIELFSQLVINEAPELIFYLIVQRIRHLIMIRDGITPEKMGSWQSMRLTNQAKFFTIEQLYAMHQKLLSIEYDIKTGTSPLTLTQHLQRLLILL